MHSNKPLQCRYGRNYSDIDELVGEIPLEESHGTSWLRCQLCNFTIDKEHMYFQNYIAVGWCSSDYEKLRYKASIQHYLNYEIGDRRIETSKSCPRCFRHSNKSTPLYSTRHLNGHSTTQWEVSRRLVFVAGFVFKLSWVSRMPEIQTSGNNGFLESDYSHVFVQSVT